MQLVLRMRKMEENAPLVEHLLDAGYELSEVEELINEGMDQQCAVLLVPKSGTTNIEFFPHQMRVISVADVTVAPEPT